MKRIILFVTLLTASLTCIAHPTHVPEGPTYSHTFCLPRPNCITDAGKSEVLGETSTGAFGMINTQISLLWWSSWDLTHYRVAQSRMVMMLPGTTSPYHRAYKRGMATAQNYTVHYWLVNKFGNGANVKNDSQWAVGYQIPWQPYFIPQWFYEVTTSTGPITKP